MTPEMEERVRLLLDTNAVLPVAGWELRACVVHGATGVYTVRAYRSEVTCDCLAGQTGAVCSHQLAAMVVWHDRLAAVDSRAPEG